MTFDFCKQCSQIYACGRYGNCHIAEAQKQGAQKQGAQQLSNWVAQQVSGSDDLRIQELETRVTQLEKLVHYPYLAGKQQVERIDKLEYLYAPLRSDAGATLAMVSLLRKMLKTDNYGVDDICNWRHEAREILEKYTK